MRQGDPVKGKLSIMEFDRIVFSIYNWGRGSEKGPNEIFQERLKRPMKKLSLCTSSCHHTHKCDSLVIGAYSIHE